MGRCRNYSRREWRRLFIWHGLSNISSQVVYVLVATRSPYAEAGVSVERGVLRNRNQPVIVSRRRVRRCARVGSFLSSQPGNRSDAKLLEQFKRTHLPVALVVDEFGGVQGLVSLTDVIGSIVGDLPSEPGEEPSIVRREDGSWLLDGAVDLDTVLRTLDAESLLSENDRQHYHTLGGLAMLV